MGAQRDEALESQHPILLSPCRGCASSFNALPYLSRLTFGKLASQKMSLSETSAALCQSPLGTSFSGYTVLCLSVSLMRL